jgi:hypothetical protein
MISVVNFITYYLGYRANGVKLDIWYHIPSKDIGKLYKDPRYPDNPDHTTQLSTFDCKELGKMYGSRLSAVYEVTNTFYCICSALLSIYERI